MKKLAVLISVLLLFSVAASALCVYATPSEYYKTDFENLFGLMNEDKLSFHADYMLFPALPFDMGGSGTMFYCSDNYNGLYEQSEDSEYLYPEYYSMVYPTLGVDLLPEEAVRPYLFKGTFDCGVQIFKSAALGREYLEKAKSAEGAVPFKSAKGFDGVLTTRWFLEDVSTETPRETGPASVGAEGATVKVSLSLIVNDVFWVTFYVYDRSGTDAVVHDYVNGGIDAERSGKYNVEYTKYGRSEYYPEFLRMLADVTEYARIPLTATNREARKLVETARLDARFADEFLDFPTLNVKIIALAETSSDVESSIDEQISEEASSEDPIAVGSAEGSESPSPEAEGSQEQSGEASGAVAEDDGNGGGASTALKVVVIVAVAAVCLLIGFLAGRRSQSGKGKTA